ncbi:glycosyltransferase [Nocardia huaxiensis]|uniref:glycosyltransferase n=1 Tax=Nocardia huaxiensis TaxID=2755382 RepID=UPI001E363336|nr:glycosyltransferase [Nocardia huaxiensis]UFS98368.1 glycosyltransferase [Nocardia huaxiensis]
MSGGSSMTGPTSAQRVPELVSIIIPVYDGLPDLDVQLDGLARQDYSGAFEVIVSDNGSGDGLAEHISNHPQRAELRLRYLDSSAKQGAPYARNRGAAIADGDFLVFVDQDDRVYEHWLSALVEVAAEVDAVGGAIESDSLNDRTAPIWRPVPTAAEGFRTHWLPFANGNNTAFWRSAFEKLGGYDEDLTVGDDVDISWRLQLAGMSFAHAPDALIAYRLRGNFRAAWRQSRGYGYGFARTCIKHRAAGCPRIPAAAALSSLLIAIACNPLNPLTRKQVPVGLWVMHTAGLLGRAQANLRYRTYTG